MTSIFNPETFMNTQVSESFETRVPPWPADEFICRIEKVEAAAWESQRTGESGGKLNVTFTTDDPRVIEATGNDHPLVTWGIMLDLNPDGSMALGPGKNTKLGRLRDAIDQNASGVPWNPQKMVGQVCRVAIKHRLYEGEVYTDVKGVAHL